MRPGLVNRAKAARQAERRPRWWENRIPDRSVSSHSNANEAAFFANEPSNDDFVLDILSNEQMAEIETAWFTIDADHSGYL